MLWILVLFIHLSTLLSGAADISVVKVSTSEAEYNGKFVDGVEKFLGISYGQAILFDAPFPTAHISAYDAFEFGDQCLQRGQTDGPFQRAFNSFQTERFSEQCLNLNIIAPKGASAGSTKYPVVVYLHSGDFYHGGNAEYSCDPSNIVAERQNVIFVTPNYRLGPYGWLYNIEAEDEQELANFGLHDILYVLEWVRDNIGVFGGDKDSVTLMGHSSGGIICTYLLEILGREDILKKHGQLIHRMIISSASHMLLPLSPKSRAINTYKHICNEVCNPQNFSATKSLIMNRLAPSIMTNTLENQGSGLLHENTCSSKYNKVFGPAIDRHLIKQHFSKVLDNPQNHNLLKIPVLLTMMTADGANFVPNEIRKLPSSLAEMAFLKNFLRSKPISNEVARSYLSEGVPVNKIATEALFKAPMLRLREGFERAGISVYPIEFDETFSIFSHIPENSLTKQFAASHYTDHVLFFNPTIPKSNDPNGMFQVPQEKSKAIRDFFLGFITEGDQPEAFKSYVKDRFDVPERLRLWLQEDDLPIDWDKVGVYLPIFK